MSLSKNTHCFVPNCKTGYRSGRKDSKNFAIFQAPKDPERLALWQANVPRLDRTLGPRDGICEIHFADNFIQRTCVKRNAAGDYEEVPRKKLKLMDDAVPTVFPDCPSYLEKSIPNSRFRKKNYCDTELRSASTSSPEKVEYQIVLSPLENPLSLSGPAAVDYVDIGLADVQQCSNLTTLPNSETCCEIEENAKTLPSSEPSNQLESTNTITLATFEDVQLWESIPDYWVRSYLSKFDCLRFFYTPSKDAATFKSVQVNRDLTLQVFIGLKNTSLFNFEQLIDLQHLRQLLETVEKLKLCPGSFSASEELRMRCIGYTHPSKSMCHICLREELRKEKKEAKLKTLKGSARRMKKKIQSLEEKLQESLDACAKAEIDFKDLDLPDTMKEAIRTCLDVAKHERRGVRYSQKWLYECILLKLRSGSTYEYLINHDFLPLPSIATVRRYLKNLKPCYGFQTKVFEQLKEKYQHVSAMERRGVILIDEMKLTENVHFDRNELKVQGFVDLGVHTPEEKKNELGDHALVMLFQPFTGRWLQPIGSFLSRGAASNTVLYQLLIEATILLENSGFSVDGVVSDGATWNRSMWTKFGVGKNQCSCEHLCDEERRFWFFSDFPHLIKNLRNWMWRMGIFHTPDGTVEKRHWEELLKVDNAHGGFGLKQCPKLTPNHLKPAHYQKMNVALAYQVFDGTVSSAMEFYKQIDENLADSGDTINFIRRIRRLIDCMSGRYPKNALRARGVEEIRNFLEYLDQWESICTLEEVPFLTDNTAIGLHVTLNSTLELYQYLTEKHGFSYLMTTRVNQDNLEKFFGMVRAAGGNNDHPDSVMFAYIYKLLSAYSLLRTVKGSNVPEGEVLTSFQSMMRENVLVGEEDNKKTPPQELWKTQMDRIVNSGELFDVIDDENELFKPLTEGESASLTYLCGYMVRNVSKFAECSFCIESFTADELTDDMRCNLIKIRDYYHVLKYPSERLYQLCQTIEEVIITEMEDCKDLHSDTFFVIADKLEERSLPHVGCEESGHAEQVTQKVLNFYLIMRMNFICRQFNKNLASSMKKKKAKQQKKNSKL